MAGLNDLSAGDVAEFRRLVRKLATGAPLQNASIGEGGLLVDGGVITIENEGGLKVTGSIDVIGQLIASGVITMSGTFTQTGESTFTGPSHFQGDTDVTGKFDVDGPMATTGTLDVKGPTTLDADLTVGNEGRIMAGDTTIFPNGTINFDNKLIITGADPNGNATISYGFATYYLTPDNADYYFHQFAGGGYFEGPLYGHGGLRIDDLPTTTQPANLYIDPATGVVKRSTA